jgi:hypothetical protein
MSKTLKKQAKKVKMASLSTIMASFLRCHTPIFVNITHKLIDMNKFIEKKTEEEIIIIEQKPRIIVTISCLALFPMIYVFGRILTQLL